MEHASSATSPDLEEGVHHLFAYGTLRPDDVKGAPWTKQFREGMRWRRARVPSARLFADRYPFVVLSSSPSGHEAQAHDHDGTIKHADYVVGYVMSCDDPVSFRSKMERADAIEGYPHYYQRSVVEAIIEKEEGERLIDGHERSQHKEKEEEKKVKCFIYHRQEKSRLSAFPVWCGDWAFVGLQHPITPTDALFAADPNRTTK